MTNKIEIWKDIPGYEGQYQVSTLGNVRSLDRVITCEGKVKGKYTSLRKGKLLRPGRSSSGHLTVALGKNNSMSVHFLVLFAFVGRKESNGVECLHINGIPFDNRVENLRWGTRSENMIDAYAHGARDVEKNRAALAKGRASRWAK
jgi:hypothetical protein